MIVISILVVLAGMASAVPKTININQIVDLKLEMANRLAVMSNRTSVDYGSGIISSMSYEGAVGIGQDSLFRTKDCEMRFNGNSITYVYHIGQNILATFFRKLTYQDVSGSGYYRAHNNSVEYSYTVNYIGAACNVRLEALKLSLDDVEAYVQDRSWFTSTDPEFNTFVQEYLIKDFNSKLLAKSNIVENSLQSVFCGKQNNQEHPTQGLDVLREFLFE